ncbi:hypothetical protein FD05_GL000205 [Lentilactobacillus otakiensis DSM 19908 = JCM 15040]|nr:hypothetical protein FD05_GL000205 [Lentilactobacillus otakiensis DSM 19908 = JCM 15040]
MGIVQGEGFSLYHLASLRFCNLGLSKYAMEKHGILGKVTLADVELAVRPHRGSEIIFTFSTSLLSPTEALFISLKTLLFSSTLK